MWYYSEPRCPDPNRRRRAPAWCIPGWDAASPRSGSTTSSPIRSGSTSSATSSSSFAIGNAGAAVAGALYAFYLSYIEPGYLSIEQSLAIVAMALLGGRDWVAGPIVGAFILTALPHVIELSAEVRILVYGLILILTILACRAASPACFARRRHVL